MMVHFGSVSVLPPRELNNEEIDWIKYAFDIPDVFVEEAGTYVTKTPTGVTAGIKRSLSDMTEHSIFSFDEPKPTSKRSKDIQRALQLDNNQKVEPSSPKSQGENEVVQGRWTKKEMSILLFVTKKFIAQNLKVIGDICLFCGVNRPRRAIDKQLKRMLQYERWSRRKPLELKSTIDNLILSRGFSLSLKEQQKLDEAVVKHSRSNSTDFV
mmetsp:Transcript_13718/g.30330  ORF Transcript_13718/g.30330 Transcript_13718/m.30330 type:complete len:211 (+) Transcript_13718:62-694(+)